MTKLQAEAIRYDLLRAAEISGSALPLSVEVVQRLYDGLLACPSDRSDGLIPLGIAFGELVVARGGFEWVDVEEVDWGREISVRIVATETVCHPISMIEKRLDRSERIDIAWMLEATIETMMRTEDLHGGDRD